MTTYFVLADWFYGYVFVRVAGTPLYIRWELLHPVDAAADVKRFKCQEVELHQLPQALIDSPDFQSLEPTRGSRIEYYRLTGRY